MYSQELKVDSVHVEHPHLRIKLKTVIYGKDLVPTLNKLSEKHKVNEFILILFYNDGRQARAKVVGREIPPKEYKSD